MNLHHPALISKYGSWVRVQVAFYDFIFKRGTSLCPTHFNRAFVSAAISGGRFGDGDDLYETTIKAIEEIFPVDGAAWVEFLKEEGIKP